MATVITPSKDMNNGAWGDDIEMEEEGIPTCYPSLDDILERWEVPNLNKAANIEKAFPVTLVTLDASASAGARHLCAIRRNSEIYDISDENHPSGSWRDANPPRTDDETWDYDGFLVSRLFYALGAHGWKYTVESGRSDEDICVISYADEAYETPARRPQALNALKNSPVSWVREENDPRVHHVKLHVTKSRSLGVTADTVKKSLLAELNGCSDCAVISAPTSEFLFTVVIGATKEDEMPSIAPAPAPSATALSVLKNAAISWDREGAAHHIKLHRKKIANGTCSAAQVYTDLLAALKNCTDCSVVAHKQAQNENLLDGYICTVTLL